MTQLYEGMFLLDNQVVREDWKQAKSTVTDLVAKHGGKVVSARRWDERRLSYPIKTRQRGTYLLAYFEQDSGGAATIRRDLDIEERVLRYLLLGVDALPEGELELSQAELADDFVVPPPPNDDEPAAAEREESTPEPGAETAAKEPEAAAASDEGTEAAPAAEAPEETTEAAAPAKTTPEASAPATTTPEAAAPAEATPDEAKKES